MKLTQLKCLLSDIFIIKSVKNNLIEKSIFIYLLIAKLSFLNFNSQINNHKKRESLLNDVITQSFSIFLKALKTFFLHQKSKKVIKKINLNNFCARNKEKLKKYYIKFIQICYFCTPIPMLRDCEI